MSEERAEGRALQKREERAGLARMRCSVRAGVAGTGWEQVRRPEEKAERSPGRLRKGQI